MTKMIMLRNPNDDMQDKLNKFWTSLSAWMDQQEVIEKYFRGEYTEYDNGWNGGTFYLNIDYEQEYKIQYGESYPEFAIGNRGINIDEIKDFVEIMIIPGFFEPPVRILRATIPENESHAFR